VANDAVIGEMRRHQQATYDRLDNLTRSLYSGGISLEQWQLGVAVELKDAHLAQSMFAVGGRRNMTAVEWGRVGGTLRDEYRYLHGFAEGIAAGTVSEAQALARIKQYGNATQQSYWREYSEATKGLIHWRLGVTEEHCKDCPANAAGSPYTSKTLPNYPGDGSTTCRGNCTCYLERIE
jgi:hypothetical protein